MSAELGGVKERQLDVSYNRAPVDNIIYSNDRGAQIVLGGDRVGPVSSGYGGLGFRDSSAIDIVVGRGKSLSTEQKTKNLPAVSVNPSFIHDAARIYISERSNIDKYFKVAKGAGKSKSGSAVGIKADYVRVVGRQGIKLVTRAGPTNSSGGESGVSGIELIAGNDDTYLQPMVLGNNLANCIERMLGQISDVQAQVHSLMNYVESFVFDHYSAHVHGPPGTPPVTAAAAISCCIPEVLQHVTEDNVLSDTIVDITNDCLNPQNLLTYILSSYNKLN